MVGQCPRPIRLLPKKKDLSIDRRDLYWTVEGSDHRDRGVIVRLQEVSHPDSAITVGNALIPGSQLLQTPSMVDKVRESRPRLPVQVHSLMQIFLEMTEY
jgi:hypothetical protein